MTQPITKEERERIASGVDPTYCEALRIDPGTVLQAYEAALVKLEAEIERLKEALENHETDEAMNVAYELGFQKGRSVAIATAEAESEKLREANEKLRETLKPFADISFGRESLNDGFEFEIARTAETQEYSVGQNVKRARLLMREFRTAAAALKETGE